MSFASDKNLVGYIAGAAAAQYYSLILAGLHQLDDFIPRMSVWMDYARGKQGSINEMQMTRSRLLDTSLACLEQV